MMLSLMSAFLDYGWLPGSVIVVFLIVRRQGETSNDNRVLEQRLSRLEEQARANARPYLVLQIDPSHEYGFKIENVGEAHAINVSIDPVTVGDFVMHFQVAPDRVTPGDEELVKIWFRSKNRHQPECKNIVHALRSAVGSSSSIVVKYKTLQGREFEDGYSLWLDEQKYRPVLNGPLGPQP